MDYEKKHKEEVVRATQLWECGDITRENLEYIFPELAEPEDERIRKALIDGFTVMKESKNCGKTFSNHNIPVADILAWLEKQGKSKWTEEDEKMLNRLIGVLDGTKKEDYHEGWEDIFLPWLKSLKPQKQWKPTEEQIQALKEACDEHWEPDGLHPLYTLYERIKQL